MLGSIGSLAFTYPWALAGLAILPILWFLLRVTPPIPKEIFFPAARFLEGLISQEKTPSKTPWWILLLRTLIAGLLIIALSGPILNPVTDDFPRGDIRIVVDNGWASAQNWKNYISQIQETLNRASRNNRSVYILQTTHNEGHAQIEQKGPMPASSALALIKNIEPNPWNADYAHIYEYLKSVNIDTSIHTFWIGDGLNYPEIEKLLRLIQSQGGLTYFRPSPEDFAIYVKIADARLDADGSSVIRIDGPKEKNALYPITIQAIAKDESVVYQRKFDLEPDDFPQTIALDIPQNLPPKVTKFRIAEIQSAATTYLTHTGFVRRNVGIVSDTVEGSETPFIDSDYYLQRALQISSNVVTGTIQDILDLESDVIILPDIGGMPTSVLNDLEAWVRNGGILIRFAGPAMAAASETFLTPVRLQQNIRSLDGDLSWNTPLAISKLSEKSPFYDLSVPDEIVVNRQILPRPEEDLENKIWANLEDKTPFVSASYLDTGLIVLFHTTASPEWSNFALSGLYVEMLNRIIELSGNTQSAQQISGYLDPVVVLDGFGNMGNAQKAQSIVAQDFEDIVPSSNNPPGIYARAGYQRILNLGDRLKRPKPLTDLPQGIDIKTYSIEKETDLTPYFLALAFCLLLLDWVIILILSFSIFRFAIPYKAAIILFLMLPVSAHAQDIELASELHLAYIKTADSTINSLAERGLNKLAATLRQRTSVEPVGSIGVDIEKDDLAFFPILYWPIPRVSENFSDTAIQKIQTYIDTGGMILFDTLDAHYAPQMQNSLNMTANARNLQGILRGLTLPAFKPIDQDHVLGKSFYLLNSFPGRYDNGLVWVEAVDNNDVSSIIIGGHDWASGWAGDSSQNQYQQEMTLRFGVNLVMYALTGNYKADQVHIPHILERLGQ